MREPIATLPIGRNCPDFGTGISINRSFLLNRVLYNALLHTVYLKLIGKDRDIFSFNKVFCAKIAIKSSFSLFCTTYIHKKEDRVILYPHLWRPNEWCFT